MVFESNNNFDNDESENLSLLLRETRVKKYKSYRIKLKKEHAQFSKNDDIDKLRVIEKKIKKINPKLVIDSNSLNNIFLGIVVNETSDHGYLDEARMSLKKLESKKLKDLLDKQIVASDKFQEDPTFDKKGNLSIEWLKNDSKFNELKDLQEWNNLMIENNGKIQNILKDKIFTYKNSIYTSSNDKTIKEIMPKNVIERKVYKNRKIKKIFFIIFGIFSINILLIIIFMILLFGS